MSDSNDEKSQNEQAVPIGESEQQQQRRMNRLLALWKSQALQQQPVNEVLQAITQEATEILEVERVGVWLFSEDRSCIRCVELFERTTGKHDAGLVVDSAKYPAYFRALGENLAIAADDAHADPRTKELAPTYLSALGITSMLDAPIRDPGGLRGVLCHEHVGPRRHWTSADQMLAASLADLVSIVFD